MDVRQKYNPLRVALAMSLAFSALQARADGEQIEGGSTWVDPVEFFKLQDIDYTDCRRDYDQGDIDFNNVLLKSGVKVYGLRLKPLCIAGHVEEFPRCGRGACRRPRPHRLRAGRHEYILG